MSISLWDKELKSVLFVHEGMMYLESMSSQIVGIFQILAGNAIARASTLEKVLALNIVHWSVFLSVLQVDLLCLANVLSYLTTTLDGADGGGD